MLLRSWPLTAAVLAATLGSAQAADAQILKKIGERAKQAAERETLREVDRKTTEVVRCALEDQACIRKAEREGKTVEKIGKGGSASAAAGAAPGEGVWANYDFIPGEQLLFAEDFSRDNVGDFPRRLEMLQGNMEVVETQGSRYLRATSASRFVINLPAVLPERFTVEFDVQMPGRDGWWNQLYLATAEPPNGYKSILVNQQLTRYPHAYFQLSGHYKSGVRGGKGGESLAEHAALGATAVPVRIMVDGAHAKMYLGEHRVANVPNADLKRSRQLAIFMAGSGLSVERPVLIGNLRIAAGGRKLYEALTADGRVATQGILFDTGSDRIRPESTPTLKEIGEMLRTHADLRLRIEGHTDNVGAAEANQALSGRRAEAVRQHLIGSYGIDAARLDASGIGQARPVDSNETPEGRQRNRRVELVRIGTP